MPKRKPSPFFRRLSPALAALLIVIGCAYHVWPFLRDYYRDAIDVSPAGYELWTYSMGSIAFFERRADPYDNRRLIGLVKTGAFSSGHPNPDYDRRALVVIGDEDMNGYLGSPFTLLLFRLLHRFDFHSVLRIWPMMTLLAIGLPLTLLAGRLLAKKDDDAWTQTAVILWTANLLIWNRAFWVHTIHHGQIEALYVAPVLAAFLLLGPKESLQGVRTWRIATAAALVAFAACVKIFPAIILLVYFWIGASRWFRSMREKKPLSVASIPEIRLAGIGLAVIVLIVVLTAAAIENAGGDFLAMSGAWRVKVDASLHNLTLIFHQNNPHMAPYLQNYLLYLLHFWLRMGTTFDVRTVRLIASAVSFAVLLLVAWRASRPRTDQRPLIALFIAALPTLLPHWWNYYNTFLLVPFLILAGSARAERRADRGVVRMAALCAAYVLMVGNYVLIGDFFQAVPDATIFLCGHPFDFLLYDPTPYNILFGYPGNLLLFLIAFRATTKRVSGTI